VAWPVITSTLTTLVAFWPLLLWPGIMGQFMSFLPRTLIIVLLASLFVAMIINPAICSVFIKARPRDADEKPHAFVAGYERVLRAALRHRIPVLLLGFTFLILTVQIYARWGKGIELFPEVDPRNATVSVKFPQGTSIERTDEALRSIEETVSLYPDIKFTLTTIGAQSGMSFGGGPVLDAPGEPLYRVSESRESNHQFARAGEYPPGCHRGRGGRGDQGPARRGGAADRCPGFHRAVG